MVPYCPESRLSGIGHTDFIEEIWYHRTIDIPQEWSARSVLLHFGGCDYMTEAYIDGAFAGRHYGATCAAKAGEL